MLRRDGARDARTIRSTPHQVLESSGLPESQDRAAIEANVKESDAAADKEQPGSVQGAPGPAAVSRDVLRGYLSLRRRD